MAWRNCIVSLSNFYGLRAVNSLWLQKRNLEAFVVFSSVTASFMLHATDTRFNLPGVIKVDKRLQNIFLWIDRVLSVVVAAVVLLGRKQSVSTLSAYAPIAILGLLLNTLSLTLKDDPYVLTHTIWHFLAYHLVYALTKD
mmetsp:Transcript_23968/g.26603  ORF Transcript_23968/g.26603 Transcript_23968/m.26603 type:complete len:140 (-) Transcript_23968:306-725(-)